jgi:orotate phosphoribosyltransferase
MTLNSLHLLNDLPVRNGHFVLESGYHTDVWLTLDALFRDPAAIAPAVAALANALRPYNITAICGPLLGGAFLAQAIAQLLELRFYHTTPIPGRSNAPLFGARYQLPGALHKTAGSERFAVVDDVISAGSSVRASIEALRAAHARVEVVGAFLLLGDAARQHFAAIELPVVALGRRDFNIWDPANCPLCSAGSIATDPAQVD